MRSPSAAVETDASFGEADKRGRSPVEPDHGIEFPLFYEKSASPHRSCLIPADDDPSIDVRPPHPTRNDFGTSIEMADAHGRHLPAAVCGVIVRMGSPRLP
jgi:hypothetical protein